MGWARVVTQNFPKVVPSRHFLTALHCSEAGELGPLGSRASGWERRLGRARAGPQAKEQSPG